MTLPLHLALARFLALAAFPQVHDPEKCEPGLSEKIMPNQM
jgi:hypothetical protein